MPERGTVIRVYIQHLVGSTLNHSTFDFGYAVQGYVVRHGPPRKKPFLLSLFLSLFSTLNPLTVKIAPTTEYAAQHREPSPISLHIVKCCCCLGKWKCRRWRRSFALFAAAVPICRSLGAKTRAGRIGDNVYWIYILWRICTIWEFGIVFKMYSRIDICVNEIPMILGYSSTLTDSLQIVYVLLWTSRVTDCAGAKERKEETHLLGWWRGNQTWIVICDWPPFLVGR